MPNMPSRNSSSSKQEEQNVDTENSELFREGKIYFQTEKPFTLLSAVGIGYGVTTTAIAIPLILSTTIPMGGSPQVFWGFVVIAVVGLATALTLAELISAIPHPGGQYIWVNKLAPKKYQRGLSYATAVISWLSAVAIGSSASLALPLAAFKIVTLFHPNFIYERWMGFAMFQAINAMTCFGACFEHVLPKISNALLLLNIITVGVIVITLFAMSNTRTSVEDFFKIVNISGWPDGVAFIIGANGLNWCLSCLDAVTHLAEEIPSPSTNIPKALIWTAVIAVSTGILMILAIFINMDPTTLTDYSGVSIFYDITGSKAATVALWILIFVVSFGAIWAIQTWQSRLAWTLSRESGFPLHRHLSKILPRPFYTPVWSLVGSAVVTALFGCLYLASELAFNSLIATGIILQYISYSIPTVLLVWQGRSNFQHGPFWYPKLGLLANLIMLGWALLALVFYCFPTYAEVIPSQMNYVSGVLVLIAILVTSLWFLYAKKNYNVIDI